MNSIYRSIWNESLNSWVAVPESQAARGKPSRSGASKTVRAGLVSASLLFTLAGVPKAVLAVCNSPDAVTGVSVAAGESCSAALNTYTGPLTASGAGAVLNATDPAGVNIDLSNNGAGTAVSAANGASITLQGANNSFADVSGVLADNAVVNIQGSNVVTGPTSGPLVNMSVLFPPVAQTQPQDPLNPVAPAPAIGMTGVAFYASNNGTINLNGTAAIAGNNPNNTVIYLSGAGAVGLAAGTGGVINVKGPISIYSDGANTPQFGAVVAGSKYYTGATQGTINLTDVSIYASNASESSGLGARMGGLINVTGNTYIRMQAGSFSTPINAQVDGRIYLGPKTVVDFSSNAINGGAIVAELGTTAGVPLDKVSLIGFSSGVTQGEVIVRTDGGPGIVAANSSIVDFSGGKLDVQVGVPVIGATTVAHPYGRGIWVTGANSIVKYQDATVLSNNMQAIYAEAGGVISSDGVTKATTLLDNQDAIEATGSGSQINLGSVQALAQGGNAYGLLSTNSAKISTLGDVTTAGTGAGGYAAVAASGGTIGVGGGLNAYAIDPVTSAKTETTNGVQATSGGTVAVTGAITALSKGTAIDANASNSFVTASSADVTTSGANSYGIHASNGGYVALTDPAKASTISTLGDNSHGIHAEGAVPAGTNGGNNISIAGDVTVNAAGAYAHGLRSVNGAKISALGDVTAAGTGVGGSGHRRHDRRGRRPQCLRHRPGHQQQDRNHQWCAGHQRRHSDRGRRHHGAEQRHGHRGQCGQ